MLKVDLLKEDKSMEEIFILAKYFPGNDSETLVGFYTDENQVKEALKELVTFRFDSAEVRVSREFNYRVHRFKTNMRIEVTPRAKEEKYITVFSTDRRNTYGIYVDENDIPQGCTCKSWAHRPSAAGCKHMQDYSGGV